MVTLRSLFFTFAFYTTTFVQMILYAPFYFLMPRKKAWIVPKTWARVTLFLQKYIVGTNYAIEGIENLPDGAYIIAPKHQSEWETFGLVPHLDDPALIMKRELTWIPLFGWYMAKTGIIPINRTTPIKALKTIIKCAKQKAKQGRQILIFPEGTRRQPGQEPNYKSGVVALYNELGLQVVPIAHNAGLYWPRDNFRRYPGTIRIRILPPIESGLRKHDFLDQLIQKTEKACDELLLLAAQDPTPPPMPLSAVKRLQALGHHWKGEVRH
ncbi:1-acyl-sn-glycerol-3-phosphate acyltransferase [Bartonella australis AUST/NH1]|uniref:1-acyl-sn-glycerol-3-phosphate acyltransferase n=1 Tax=Bartonella australis (strain Aust/NH1) TaxID=1094489 RepID=M1N5F8_BARAA|nr:lysophospholipid acyltransferase family protein [Bartonella australis]AGF75124.1 1-acyl-sn-glycerol-3-phosphate acyltransferase [Bartonella australis AUST/NH1]